MFGKIWILIFVAQLQLRCVLGKRFENSTFTILGDMARTREALRTDGRTYATPRPIYVSRRGTQWQSPKQCRSSTNGSSSRPDSLRSRVLPITETTQKPQTVATSRAVNNKSPKVNQQEPSGESQNKNHQNLPTPHETPRKTAQRNPDQQRTQQPTSPGNATTVQTTRYGRTVKMPDRLNYNWTWTLSFQCEH